MAMEGLVVKHTGSIVNVRLPDGSVHNCRMKGLLRTKGLRTTHPVAVGDHVLLDDANPGELLISDICPRENYIIRKSVNLSAQAQIIAANLDQAILVASLHSPRTSTGFIDRFLITCEAYQIPAMLVINKSDLYKTEDEQALLRYFTTLYQEAAYSVIALSATENQNINQFKATLKGKISLLCGHSGSGKSSLINSLNTSLNLRSGDISSAHNKGKHTTTFAEMFEIEPDTWLIDTPGVKEFGLIDIQPDELRHYFPEFIHFAQECRFANCQHLHEPDCAVRLAAENHQIAPERYDSYCGIIQSNELDA